MYSYGVSQPIHVSAWDSVVQDLADNIEDTITATVQVDDAAPVASNDANPTRVGDGQYQFTASVAEMSGKVIRWIFSCSVEGVRIASLTVVTDYGRVKTLADDLADGGRLDLIIDVVAADVAGLDGDSIPTAAAIAAVVWSVLTSTLTTAGSIGKWLVDRLTGYPYAIQPYASTATDSGRLDPTYLTAYQGYRINATILVYDVDNAPVNLSGKALSLVAWPTNDPDTAGFELLSTGESPELTIGGDDFNQITIDAAATHAAVAGEYDYRIYNTTDDNITVDGVLRIVEGRAPT
jgi:hypothetical protein